MSVSVRYKYVCICENPVTWGKELFSNKDEGSVSVGLFFFFFRLINTVKVRYTIHVESTKQQSIYILPTEMMLSFFSKRKTAWELSNLSFSWPVTTHKKLGNVFRQTCLEKLGDQITVQNFQLGLLSKDLTKYNNNNSSTQFWDYYFLWI